LLKIDNKCTVTERRYLCNAILRYFVINIQQLITLLKSNIFQQHLVIYSTIHLKLSVQNFIQIRSNLTFLLYDV